jgi:hypothetical protein
MLLASLLAMTGNIMSLGKVCWDQCNSVLALMKHVFTISIIMMMQGVLLWHYEPFKMPAGDGRADCAACSSCLAP